VAPIVVAKTSLLESIVTKSSGDLRGSLTVGSASLNWFLPIELQDIELRDEQNKTVAKIAEVTSSKTLFGIVTNLADLGTFQIVRPEVDLSVSEQGSNLEQTLAPLLKPDDQPAKEKKPGVGLGLKVIQGVVRVADTVGGRQWQIDELECDVALPADHSQPLAAAIAGRVTPAEPAGHFSIRLKVQPGDPATAKDPNDPAAAWLTGSGQVNVNAQVLPLELLEPLLRRFAGGGEISGMADIEYAGDWGQEPGQPPRGQLVGQATATQLVMVGPWFGEDRLKLASLQVPMDVHRSGNRLEVRRCDIQTDVGQLTCSGAIEDLDQLNASWFSSLWNTLPHSSGEVKGTIDLAKLARLLPNTLRVREGMQIDEGTINVDLTSGAKDGQWACAGRVDTTRLVATEATRQIVWEHPLAVSFSGHNTPRGPIIERLLGESDFLKFEGAGTPEAFNLNANFELSRLADELGKFVDLGELRLAGEGASKIHWQRNADNTFATNATLEATNLVLARPGKPAWNDAKLTINAQAAGLAEGASIQRVDSAKVEVLSAEDKFTAALAAPISDLQAKTVWPIETTLKGELVRWVARIEPWVGMPPGWDIRGRADVVSTLNCSSDVWEIAKCQADFQQLHAWGPGLYLDEPRLRVTAVGKMNAADSRLDISEVVLTATDVSARVKDVSLAFDNVTGGQKRVGEATLQCNLNTLYRWSQNPREEANWRMNGLVSAKLSANITDRAPEFSVDATIDNLEAVPRAGQPWREKQVRLVANGKYDEPTDTLQLARCDLAAEAVQLAANGRVERWSKDRQLQLSGQTSYDLEKITLLLQPYLGGEVRVTGRETHSFAIAGPLGSLENTAAKKPIAVVTANGAAAPAEMASLDFLKNMTGKADVGWQSASAYGFDVGGGKLSSSLAGGVLDVAPASFKVSGGTLLIAARLNLAPGPMELYLPKGPLVQQAEVTPEMCRHWMMYVMPVLADVTEAKGKFSVNLTGSRIPLADVQKGDVAGQVTVHTVEIGPGPMVQEFSVLMGRAAPAKLAKESNVEFRMVEGRIYHRNLELQFPEFTIRTHGSVGLDQTLAIMAEMPVPPKWLKNNAIGQALKDQTIQLPIAGTLHKPRLDQNAMDQAMAQFVRKAADGLLKNELGRQLDRLDKLIPGLQPRPQP